MKKFTLIILVALLATATSMAQSRKLRPTTQVPLPQKSQSTTLRNNVQKQNDASRMLGRHMATPAKKGSVKMEAKGQKRVVKSPISGNEEMITNQPAGTKVYYSRSGYAYAATLFGVMGTDYSNSVGTVVFGENNEIYFKNLISQYATNSWVKGTIDGNKIKITFPQKVLDLNGEGYYLDMLQFDEANSTYSGVDDLNTLTLNYNATTKAITTPLGSAFASGDQVIGLVDSDDNWTGYADFTMSFELFTDEPVTAPEGLETTLYSVSADGFEGTLAQVGFSGDDIYIQGIYPGVPEGWVKGTISNGKAIFKSGQYIGADEAAGYFQYLVSAKVEDLYDDYWEEWYQGYVLTTDDITFDYDPATKSLSKGSTFLVNAGTETVSYAASYENAVIKPFVEVAATPATPIMTEVMIGGLPYYNAGYGWGYLTFNINSSDVDGNYILPEKLSYVIYTKVNGEVKELELSNYDYIYQEEPTMVEIPYAYTDNYDLSISGSERQLWFYIIGPEEFGVQAIYRGAGEERRSEIAWMEVNDLGSDIQPAAATPAYPDIDPNDVGSNIDYGYFTGDEEIGTFGEEKPQTYDVAIKVDDPALAGTYIKSITFPIQDLTGVSNISAWISSQLRVEDGKNVPDLASVSVTPAEPGFITVNLEKPYIIPEGGEYVGYSMTIDEVTNDETAYPVVIIDKQDKGGLYMHSSRGFLKWMDFSELFAANAAIQITVSGSKVTDNSAAPVDGETTYVLTNTPIETNINIVNHGAQGIKSVDLEYTLNGATNTQHIDLSEAVAGFFGKSFTATINAPAIAQIGNYNLDVKVTKVNEVDNSEAAKVSTTPIVALNTLPKHRALLEEYTGTWCGWCPRGFVALEKLAKEYPDDYVVVSYHNSDPMEIMSSTLFPSNVEGFPTSWLDRKYEVDPYYGTSDYEPFHVAKDLAQRSKEFGYGAIEFSTSWGADGQSIDIATEVTFPYDVENGKFAIEYILVADGLTGSSSDWNQSNYYSGGTDGGDLAEFNAAESSVPGLIFNDVAVLMSEIGGIEGSLPTTIQAEKAQTHTYTFNLADAINTAGESIIQDKNKLRVVALLINTETGEVVNANKANVGQSTAINSIQSSQEKIASISYYDITGRRIDKAQHGMNIIKITYSDGSSRTMKVLKK